MSFQLRDVHLGGRVAVCWIAEAASKASTTASTSGATAELGVSTFSTFGAFRVATSGGRLICEFAGIHVILGFGHRWRMCSESVLLDSIRLVHLSRRRTVLNLNLLLGHLSVYRISVFECKSDTRQIAHRLARLDSCWHGSGLLISSVRYSMLSCSQALCERAPLISEDTQACSRLTFHLELRSLAVKVNHLIKFSLESLSPPVEVFLSHMIVALAVTATSSLLIHVS